MHLVHLASKPFEVFENRPFSFDGISLILIVRSILDLDLLFQSVALEHPECGSCFLVYFFQIDINCFFLLARLIFSKLFVLLIIICVFFLKFEVSI